MIIREALKKGIDILVQSNIEQPQSEAQILLSHLLGKDKLYLHIHENELLADDVIQLYLSFIEKRSRHMPIAYIIKEKEFMSLPFYVDERVLIPRGDTEILVEEAIRIAKTKTEQINVLDICCGSGCIGIAFAHYVKNAHVILSDISLDALQVTIRNAEALKVKQQIDIVHSDLFSQIPEIKFDMILSNPPYISSEDLNCLDADVKDYEPLRALAGGEDGLDFYAEIIPQAKMFLKAGGDLLLEIGYDQGEKVRNIMLDNGYEDVCVLKDYGGHNRVVKGKLNG